MDGGGLPLFAMVSSLRSAAKLGFSEIVHAHGEIVSLIEDGIGFLTRGKVKISGKDQIAGGFHQGCVSLAREMSLILQARATASLGEIVGDRNRSSCELAGQTKTFARRKRVSAFIDRPDELSRILPDFQFLERELLSHDLQLLNGLAGSIAPGIPFNNCKPRQTITNHRNLSPATAAACRRSPARGRRDPPSSRTRA